MKKDKTLSQIRVCPKTERLISRRQFYTSNGICPHCGHNNYNVIPHSKVILGWYVRPSFMERLFAGKEKIFLISDTHNLINHNRN